MAERQREIVDVRSGREVEFPTDPGEKFEAIFSAIGNSETKCLLLLSLSRKPLSVEELYQKFLLESGGVWKPRSKDLITTSYCLESLVPNGLVLETEMPGGSGEDGTGFMLTEAGAKYQPTAAYLLEKSWQLPFSLIKVFGQSSRGAGNTRPSLTSAKILEVLSQAHFKLRSTDIASCLGVTETVAARHLRHFSELGLVEYSSVTQEEKGFATYRLARDANEETYRVIDDKPVLSTQVANFLFRHGRVDAVSLANVLQAEHPRSSIKSLRSNISTVLSFLSQQEICEPEHFVSAGILSEAKIKPAGEDLARDLIMPIREAVGGDEALLSSWRNIFWQQYAKVAIEKYKRDSGHAHQKRLERSVDEIREIIADNPGIRLRDLQSFSGIRNYRPLWVLLAQNKIRKERQGRDAHFYAQ